MNKKLIKVSNALSLTEFKHIFRVMKLASLFGTICVSSVFAVNVNSQSLRVSIHANQEQAKEVIKQIEEQTDYLFVYNHDKVNLNSTVTIQANNETVAKVLNQMFAGTDIIYAIQGNNILLMHKDAVIQQQQQSGKVVTGTIVDPSGMPVIGANVMEKGTTNGTITDMDGKFSLNVEKGATLIISYIGFSNQEIKIGNQTNLSITMKEDAEALDELVVTALGIKREEKALGYSVQKVSGEDLSVVKGVNVASSLTGKISGLQINNSSEISESPELKLRGESPLIVIDGVAYGNMSMSDISAEDIESIDVLKGATASALYGVRGRAGAVMITTKKANKEGTLNINVSNNTMFSAGYLKMPEAQHSYSTGNYGILEYNSGNVWGDYMDGHEVEQYDPISKGLKVMPLLSKGGDNIKNFLRSTLVTNTNINISQAGKLGGYRVSATHVYQNGQYPNSKIDKFIVNSSGNITYNKFKLDASFSYKKELAPNMPKVNYGGGNILYNMLIWGGTEYDIRDFKDYWKVKDQEQNWGFKAWYDNPYYIMYERINKQDNDLMNTSLTMNYDIFDNLSVMLRSGFDNYSKGEERRQSVGDSGEKRGYYAYNIYKGSSFNNDLIVKGDYAWKDFSFNFIAGLSSYWYKNESLYSNTRGGLSIPGFYSLNASAERAGVSKTVSEKALYSAYGKAGISWKNGVFVDVTGRNDWSSSLPADSRSYFYPSVSGSVLPTAFFNPIEDVLDFWKIRTSWTVAKKDLSVYEINRVFNVSTDVWNGLSTATYPTKIRDANIKPETESSYEFGTNFRFFNNRLSFDYTYFTRLRYDRLIEANISKASGFSRMITNISEDLKQKGMEFTIGGKPVVNKDFTWESSFNLSFWHWYYHKMDPIHSSKDPRIQEGERYDKLFITDWDRDHEGNIVHQAGLPVKNKYQTVMGYSDPKCILGWTNTFKYKDFDLSISIDGRIGGLMYSWTEQAMWNSGAHPDSDNKWRYDEVVNGLQNYVGQGAMVVSGSATYDPYGKVIEDTRVFAPNNVPVSYQNYTQIYNENPWDHNARQNILDGTFIKLREVALNYTLPSDIAQKIMCKNMRVGIVGQNLLLWTKEFRFSDPDRGKENLNTPTSRYIGFNINLTL